MVMKKVMKKSPARTSSPAPKATPKTKAMKKSPAAAPASPMKKKGTLLDTIKAYTKTSLFYGSSIAIVIGVCVAWFALMWAHQKNMINLSTIGLGSLNQYCLDAAAYLIAVINAVIAYISVQVDAAVVATTAAIKSAYASVMGMVGKLTTSAAGAAKAAAPAAAAAAKAAPVPPTPTPTGP